MSNSTPDTRSLLDGTGPQRAVLVVTDDSDDPGHAVARAHAAELAARHDVPVILYDRSEETWGDTPHPEGPLDVDHRSLAEREVLRAQMRELAEMGAEVLAWVATLPSISAVETALRSTGADHVIIPATMGRKLLERAITGDSIATALRTVLGRREDLVAVPIDVVSELGDEVERV